MTGWSSSFSGIIPLFTHTFWLCLQQYLLNAKPSLVSVSTTTFLSVSPEESLCLGHRKFRFDSLLFRNHIFSCACYISQWRDWGGGGENVSQTNIYSTFQGKCNPPAPNSSVNWMIPAVLTQYFEGMGFSFRKTFSALDLGWSEALPSALKKENFNVKWSWISEISGLFSRMLSTTWCPLEENLFWKAYPYPRQGKGAAFAFETP